MPCEYMMEPHWVPGRVFMFNVCCSPVELLLELSANSVASMCLGMPWNGTYGMNLLIVHWSLSVLGTRSQQLIHVQESREHVQDGVLVSFKWYI